MRRVLVVGSGAREHALARALVRGRPDRQVVVAPGNAGTTGPRITSARLDASKPTEIVALALELDADLVVIGPEAPLAAGAVDALEAAGVLAFGPTRAAARLEASKAFLKEFAARHGIATAPFHIVEDYAAAERIIREHGAPIVVKADGLCAGKGVVVADTVDEALAAARAMLEDGVFGDAGRTVVLEDKIIGREASVHAICDGECFALLPAARDHKRVFDGDRGPNTGGMGVVCPANDVDEELTRRIARDIIEPTLRGMRAEGTPFRGVLFAGVMIDASGAPFLLEHNVRFGDPECEALMELVGGDLGAVLADAARGAVNPMELGLAHDKHACVVVLASAGYPDAPEKGRVIRGVGAAEELGATVHHAGTALANGALVSAGGRVLAVTASAPTAAAARDLAYGACARIDFDGMQYRRDIGGA